MTAEQALALDTLAAERVGLSAGVPLSTPLLMLRNNASMRRLWWRAEQWLRAAEGGSASLAGTAKWTAAHSLRTHVSQPWCTGPSCWFDEHAFPLFWRQQLAHAKVVYACCGVNDHHYKERPDRCVLEQAEGGRITRRCPSVAEYVWGWHGSGADGCGPHSFDDTCAAELPRHGGQPRSLVGCQADFGYDGQWHRGVMSVVGSGDSAGALLRSTDNQTGGVVLGWRGAAHDANATAQLRCARPIAREIAAFHAAAAKHKVGHSDGQGSSSSCIALQPNFTGPCQ